MKKKYIAAIVLFCALCILLLFVSLLGSFKFTRPTRLGKTNYYLIENAAPAFGLYHQYPDTRGSFFGVLEGRITDVYWNDEYILATQYDIQSNNLEGYYVIRMLYSVKKGVPWKKTGPFSKEEYEQQKRDLGLNEKEMKHTNLYDKKHIVWKLVRFFLFFLIVATLFIWILWFLKSKIRKYLEQKP